MNKKDTVLIDWLKTHHKVRDNVNNNVIKFIKNLKEVTNGSFKTSIVIEFLGADGGAPVSIFFLEYNSQVFNLIFVKGKIECITDRISMKYYQKIYSSIIKWDQYKITGSSEDEFKNYYIGFITIFSKETFKQFKLTYRDFDLDSENKIISSKKNREGRLGEIIEKLIKITNCSL